MKKIIHNPKIQKALSIMGWKALSTLTVITTAGLSIWAMAAFTEPTAPPSSSVQDFAKNIMGANNSNNEFDSSDVVANADGSLVERMESIIPVKKERECTDADAVGTACGGGKKFATGLVSMMGGCDGQTDEPNCPGTTDVNTYQWSYSITSLQGASSISAGSANTAILAHHDGTAAASYCYDMIKMGYDDWYLPSYNELNTLYGQKTTVGGFVNSHYWSSREYGSTDAYCQSFYDGLQSGSDKTNANYVRCIRRY